MIKKLDSNLIELEYKLLTVDDPKDITTKSLSEIKLFFILLNLDNKYDSHYIKEFRLKDFWLHKN
jgi:hypothetical protein